HLRLRSGHHGPGQAGAPKPRPLNEIEELAVFQKGFKVVNAIAAELFVLEVDGVPRSILAVQYIDRTRIRVSWYEQEQQNRRRKLDPANDFDRFGNLYQCGYRCMQIGAGVE